MKEDSISEGRLDFPFLVGVQEPETEVIFGQLRHRCGVEGGITQEVLRYDDLIVIEASQLVCPADHFYNLNLDAFQGLESYVFLKHAAPLRIEGQILKHYVQPLNDFRIVTVWDLEEGRAHGHFHVDTTFGFDFD